LKTQHLRYLNKKVIMLFKGRYNNKQSASVPSKEQTIVTVINNQFKSLYQTCYGSFRSFP